MSSGFDYFPVPCPRENVLAAPSTQPNENIPDHIRGLVEPTDLAEREIFFADVDDAILVAQGVNLLSPGVT